MFPLVGFLGRDSDTAGGLLSLYILETSLDRAFGPAPNRIIGANSYLEDHDYQVLGAAARHYLSTRAGGQDDIT